jgi:hypothetical protein
MSIKDTLSNIEELAAARLSQELSQLQADTPKLVKEFVDDYAERLMLAVFGVYIDTWGRMELKKVPEALESILVNEAMEYLPKITLSKTQITRLNKIYRDSLFNALDRKLRSTAQDDAEELINTMKEKLRQDLNSVTNLEHFIKTLDFIKQTETPS